MSNIVSFSLDGTDDKAGHVAAVNLDSVSEVHLEYETRELAINPGGRIAVEYVSGNIRKYEFSDPVKAQEVFDRLTMTWPIPVGPGVEELMEVNEAPFE